MWAATSLIGSTAREATLGTKDNAAALSMEDLPLKKKTNETPRFSSMRQTPTLPWPAPMLFWSTPTSPHHSPNPLKLPGVPPSWHHPPTFSANGTYPHMYPGGFLRASPAMPNSAYLSLAHYYAYPIPAAAPVPPDQLDNYSLSQLQFPTQIPPSFRQQQVEAYVQQHNKVLCFLHLSPIELARHACTVLVSLCYHDTPGTLEVWAD
ncbi:hypothetical protein E4T56_gene5587 [Termitomyces sp. T112]|nr:hypothetical protein E4T56_gene5587 [Termitomyces sp. T112]